MTVHTSAGTTLAIAAAAPATYDEAGYEALTFTTIGELSDIGDIPSRVYDIVTWRNLSARGETKAKGGYTLGSQTVTMGDDPDDAGQALLDAAILSDDAYSIEIAHPDLGTIYARAFIMGGTRSRGDVNTIAQRQVTLEYTIIDQTTDGVVVVAPA